MHDNLDSFNNDNDFEKLQAVENIHLKNINNEIVENKDSEISYYDSFKALLGKYEYCLDDIELVEINNIEDFSRYQHEFLSGYYITIDISDTNLKIVTENRKAFNIDINTVPVEKYSIIFKVQLPRKLCLNSKDIYKRNLKYFNSLYDISHVLNMFYGIREFDLFNLVKLFMPGADDNIYRLLNNLHIIKNELNVIVSKYKLFPLVNKEFKLLKLIASCEINGLPFVMEEYQEFINEIRDRYNKNEELLKYTYQASYSDKMSIMKYLLDNNIPTILNESYLKNVGNSNLFGISIVKRLYNNYAEESLSYKDNRLNLNIIPYDEFGNIKSNLSLNEINFPYIKTNDSKHFVIGSYPNLFYRVFANFSNIDYLISWTKDNRLAESLAERLFNDEYLQNKELYEFYAMSFLNGFIQGYFNPVDMMNYFFEELDFYLPLEDVESIANSFASTCGEILDYIYEFDRSISKDKRYSLVDNMSIYRFIKLTEADIFKYALNLIDDSLDNYNNRKKYSIDIIGIDNNIFILEADDGSFNIAFDIVNRNLTKAYNKYIKNIPALCNVKTSYKTING